MSGLWLNLGCGDNRLPAPWQNYDAELDIANTLPFGGSTVDLILIEHCVEHVTCSEAFMFFEEACRVLRHGGTLRVAVPDIERITEEMGHEYLEWLGKSRFGTADRNSAIKNIAVNHGHKSLWTPNLLCICLRAAGFRTTHVFSYGESALPELRGIEGHHKVIGLHPAWVETTVVEAVK